MTEHRIPSEPRAPRMDRLARLPVFLSLEGKRALLAGGNAAAAWKAELLSAAGAHVQVFAPEPCDEMLKIADEAAHGAIELHRHEWTADDLPGASIAIGGFEDDEHAEAFAAAARAHGVPVNVIDKPAFCDFAFGAIVNRSPLVIGISTDGGAPVFAQAIRAKLEALLPKGFALWAQAATRWRAAIKASGLPFAGRRRFWQVFTAYAVRHPDEEPLESDLTNFLNEVRGLGSAVEAGSVALVGAGPGDAELLTLRAVRALQSADVILFDDLVSQEVLDFARREAKKLLVGKTGHGPSCKQEEINDLMVNLAKQGKRIVRLKGGDPLIFARASEEIAACRDAGIAVEIVPGITAAQGAAASLGFPLTDRANAQRIQYVTGHSQDGSLPEEFDWRGLADPKATIALYMPRQTLAAFAERAIGHGLSPDTPAIAISRATRSDQHSIAGTIADLAERIEGAELAGPLLVIIGAVCLGSQVAADHRARSPDSRPRMPHSGS